MIDLHTDDVLLQNRYDGLSRRRERVQREDGVLVTNRYVYDPAGGGAGGWLVLAVLDGENEVLEQYVHGLDLSGSREGAGGIGGILSVSQSGTTNHFHYDGNGNVMSVTDSEGAIVSRYEYDPFGRVLLAEGPYTPRYQFSTKEFDEATGLNYYGYRYYNPELGRWLNRDPIEEEGGLNYYAFVLNDPINFADPFGLTECCGDTPYDPDEECCEDEAVVEKVTYWVCKSSLESSSSAWGIFSHSSICCEDPQSNPDQTCFGKYPSGNPISSPGEIRHDEGVADPANCEPEKVCPEDDPCQDGVPPVGPSGCRYWLIGGNCHDYARP